MRLKTAAQITAAAELEALPEYTMIRDHLHDVHVKYQAYSGAQFWAEVGMPTEESRTSGAMVREVSGNFTVLFRPDAQPALVDAKQVEAAAAGLAEADERIWEVAAESDREQYRFFARAVLTAAGFEVAP